MIGGFDSRCWEQAGLAVPDPLPECSFRSEDLDGYADSDQVIKWADSSGLGNHLTGQPGADLPVKQNDGTWSYAEFSPNQVLSLARAVDLCDCWALFLVVSLPTPGFATLQTATFPWGRLTVRPTRWDYQIAATVVPFGVGGNPSGLMLVSLARTGNVLTAQKNGLGVQTAGLESGIHTLLKDLGCLAVYRRVVPPIINITVPVPVYEARVFNTFLTAPQYADQVSYFTGKYGL